MSVENQSSGIKTAINYYKACYDTGKSRPYLLKSRPYLLILENISNK